MLCCGLSMCAAPDALPVRLAVLADGREEKNGAAKAMDLLLCEFSQRQELELVEREGLHLILREHGLSLAFTGEADPGSLLRCGKLLGADAVLLLKTEGHAKGGQCLRLRLLNTRHGFKLFDTLVAIASELAVRERLAKRLVERVVQHLRRVNVPSHRLKVVGVSTFRSEELAPRWDWLSDAIPSGIERNLSLRTGILLTERRAVAPLLAEREIVATLPESLMSGTLLVHGTYRVDRQADRLSVTVRVRHGKAMACESHTDGSVDALEELCARIADAVWAGMGVAPGSAAMEPSSEAEALAEEARIYISREEAARAIPPAESACALVPASVTYQKLLLDALVRGRLRWDVETREYPPEAEATFFRALSLAERIVRAHPLPAERSLSADLRHFCEISNCLNDAANYLEQRDRRGPRGDAYAACVQLYWELCRACRNAYIGQSKHLHERVLYYAGSGLHFTADLDEAIRICNWILDDQKRLGGEITAIRPLINSVRIHWSSNQDALAKTQQYLASLRAAEQAEIRLQALEDSIYFYRYVLPNYAATRKHAEEYVDLARQLRKPDPRVISHGPLAADKSESEKIEAGLLSEVLRFAHESRLIKTNTGSWALAAIRLADLLERSGRAKEAAAWLEKMMAIYGSQKSYRWQKLRDRLAALEKEHPGIKCLERLDVADDYRPRLVLARDHRRLSRAGLSSIRFRRLFVSRGELVIVYAASDDTYGVIRLGTGFRAALTVQRSAARLKLKTRKGWLMGEHMRGPAVTMHRGNVYVGFIHAGILVFQRDGQVKHLTEDSGLAYCRIRHLECLGDKLYAIVGAVSEDSGLMEIDTGTGRSRLLASTKTEDTSVELNGKLIAGIAAAPSQGLLYVLSSCDSHEPGVVRNRLHCYDPADATFRTINVGSLDRFLTSTHSIDTARGLRRCGDSLLIWRGRALYQYDLKTKQGTVLIHRHLQAKWRFPREFDSWHHVLTQRGLVTTVFRQLAEFRHGMEGPRVIPNESFPRIQSDRLDLRDLVVSKRGMYVLTSSALYLIPEIK